MVPPAELLLTQVETLHATNTALRAENERLALQVRDLRQQLWGKKAERFVAAPQPSFFGPEEPPLPVTERPIPAVPDAKSAAPSRPHQTGPKPLDPALPREVITLPDPPVAERVDDLTGRPLVIVKQETLEVLARRPTIFYVKRFVRTVWGNADKARLVYTPWPDSVWPRGHVDASVVAHIAVQHYDAHQPFYRLEPQYARMGVALPRSTQVALMARLDPFLTPIVDQIKQQVMARSYVQLDATPIPVQDPARPGKTVEGTIWGYHAIGRPPPGASVAGSRPAKPPDYIWFEYQATKSPSGPDQCLREAQYQGVLQTDAAQGLDRIGLPTGITHVGCLAHVRRYFHRAHEAQDPTAARYLKALQALWMIDRRATHFHLSPAQHLAVRARYSLPIWDAMVTEATVMATTVMPGTHMGKAFTYLLTQQAAVRRCLTTPGVRLDNNLIENDLRPFKLGAKNWLKIGTPEAGPRLANLMTVMANCRLAQIDPEAYLIDVIGRLLDHPSNRRGELVPQAWAQTAHATI